MSGPRPKTPKLVDLNLGPLPIDVVNRTLGLDLEPGEVMFSAGAQQHAMRRHPDEYAKCVPHAGSVVTKPSYIGDDFRNAGKIELVSRIVGLGGLLVAITIERDESGCYQVCSIYPVSERKIENRRQTKHLLIALTK